MVLEKPRPKADGAQVGVVPGQARPQADAAPPDDQSLQRPSRVARLAEAPGSRTQPALKEGSDRF